MFAVWNGKDTAQEYDKYIGTGEYILLYGEGEYKLNDGKLSMCLPSRSLTVFGIREKTVGVFIKDGIQYLYPKEGSFVQCDDNTVVALYKYFNGTPELSGMYINGDIIKDEDVQFQFFRWDKELRPIKN